MFIVKNSNIHKRREHNTAICPSFGFYHYQDLLLYLFFRFILYWNILKQIIEIDPLVRRTCYSYCFCFHTILLLRKPSIFPDTSWISRHFEVQVSAVTSWVKLLPPALVHWGLSLFAALCFLYYLCGSSRVPCIVGCPMWAFIPTNP